MTPTLPVDVRVDSLQQLFDTFAELPGVLYVATPYTNYPGGHNEGWKAAVRVTAALAAAGVSVYSPIVHWHPVATVGKLGNDPLYWLSVNTRMMNLCSGLLVMQLPGWSDSMGVHKEIEFFHLNAKPIFYVPVPDEMLF